MNSGIKNEFQFILQHFLWLNTTFLILITSKIDYKKLISAFLFGLFFSEIVSYLVFFNIIELGKLKKLHLLNRSVSPFDPTFYASQFLFCFFYLFQFY